jgi:hypothetical protein
MERHALLHPPGRGVRYRTDQWLLKTYSSAERRHDGTAPA